MKSGDSEAMSEQLLFAYLVVGDDEVYSSKEEEEEGEEEEEEEEGEEETTIPLRQCYRSFILPQIWSVNDFIPKMLNDVFGRLRP